MPPAHGQTRRGRVPLTVYRSSPQRQRLFRILIAGRRRRQSVAPGFTDVTSNCPPHTHSPSVPVVTVFLEPGG